MALWDARRGERLGEAWQGEAGPLNAISLSPNGALLAAGGESGRLTLWDLDPAIWKETACRIANRNLTQADWEQVLADLPFHETRVSQPVAGQPLPGDDEDR